MTISCAKRGTVVEHMAKIEYLKAGFEVFTNIVQTGPVDLIVWDGVTSYPIDTKKVTKYIKADGTAKYHYGMASDKRNPSIYYLGFCEEDGCWVWLCEDLHEIPDPLRIF